MRQPTRRQFLAGGPVMAAAPLRAAVPDAPPRRHIFEKALTPERLASSILPRAKWRPLPPSTDRAAWEGLPSGARQSALQRAEPHLTASWEVLPATVFLEFRRYGNRSNYERIRNIRRDRLCELVVAECIEGKGRFLDQIVNGVWATCEETYWGVPAHVGVQKAGSGLPDVTEPTVDLFAAETSALLAWTDYLLGPALDKVSPLVRKRIAFEIDRRILTPNLERDDFTWMGLGSNLKRAMNNWNPWINSNWLTSVLLMEGDERRRLAAIRKIALSLDRFLDSYYDDGGCDEGPGYWGRAGASLFECLELLYSASGGKLDFYSVPLVREMGRYVVRAHIADDWFTNFADASARIRLAGDLVYRYGKRVGDQDMQLLGAWAARHPGGGRVSSDSIGRIVPALFNLKEITAAPARQPLLRDAWMPGIQVMTARQRAGSADGLYLAAQGGHNAESHNHNDVGNFIVFADGHPAIIDVGVETYTAKTFSRNRYDIWTMQSAYHNLPTIGGVMQAAGREYAARDVSCSLSDAAAEMRLDIAGAYPAEAGIQSWKRLLRLDRRKQAIQIEDEYSLQRQPGKITLTLMTTCRIAKGPGALTLSAEGFRQPVQVRYSPSSLSPVIEEIRTEDARLKPVWGGLIYRILLVDNSPRQTGRYSLVISQSA